MINLHVAQFMSSDKDCLQAYQFADGDCGPIVLVLTKHSHRRQTCTNQRPLVSMSTSVKTVITIDLKSIL